MKNFITIDGQTISSEFDDELKDKSALQNFFRDDDKVPLSKLSKYYLNENLNFLCGSGTSVEIGGNTINKGENPFEEIIEELKKIEKPENFITQLINYFESEELLEKQFDKINQEYFYYLNNQENTEIANSIKSYLQYLRH